MVQKELLERVGACAGKSRRGVMATACCTDRRLYKFLFLQAWVQNFKEIHLIKNRLILIYYLTNFSKTFTRKWAQFDTEIDIHQLDPSLSLLKMFCTPLRTLNTCGADTPGSNDLKIPLEMLLWN